MKNTFLIEIYLYAAPGRVDKENKKDMTMETEVNGRNTNEEIERKSSNKLQGQETKITIEAWNMESGWSFFLFIFLIKCV